MLNKKNPGPANQVFEQREILLNNTVQSLYSCSEFQISEQGINVFNKEKSYKRLLFVNSPLKTSLPPLKP